ncbi:MAG TPA: FGGY family carbohydrate kinase [Solirubrobacteraceae bacterium]|nr:FGGY family carbohydrate kinase [Solirubrobacteraceae bacterium]
MTLLGIDIGSSAVKGARVELADGSVQSAHAEVELHSPHPGWAEADPGQWWAGVCAVTRELVAESGAPIEAVACSGMVPAVLALDADGRPLRRAILQNDARADAEVTELAAELSDLDLVALTGSALTQQSVAPTLRWLRRHEPDLFAGTASLAGSYDWLARQLGARPHVERNWALESGLFGLDGEPLAEVIARSEVDPDLLPDVAAPGEVVGEVSAAAAADTGLPEGTPIVVGGADHVSSAYGAGLVSGGDWLVKLGGAGDILAVSEEPLIDARLYLDAHPAGGWLPNGCMATSGSLVRWLAAVCGEADLDALDAEAAAVPPGAGGVVCLPYFLGEKSPLHDPRQRGAFVGLHLGHGRGHLYRAALEAVAFGFRHHVDVFRELGVDLSAARVTNGGSRSMLWKRILADVLGTPLSPVIDHPGASFGAALAAGVGIGSASGWSIVTGLARLGAPIEPRPAYRERYEELYGVYRSLEPALRPISHRLAAGDWSGE